MGNQWAAAAHLLSYLEVGIRPCGARDARINERNDAPPLSPPSPRQPRAPIRPPSVGAPRVWPCSPLAAAPSLVALKLAGSWECSGCSDVSPRGGHGGGTAAPPAGGTETKKRRDY